MPTPIDRINVAAAEPHAAEHLTTYFHHPGHIAGLPGFTGAWFERLGNPTPEDSFLLTAADLSALSTLSVEVPAPIVIRLLHQLRPQIEELLSRIPVGLAIWEADDDVLGPESAAKKLYRLVRRTGERSDRASRWVTAHKLCARKRPALLPVYDSQVQELVDPGDGQWWPAARRAMQQERLRQRLVELRREAKVPEEITLLRVLDVVLWMEQRHRSRRGPCGHP